MNLEEKLKHNRDLAESYHQAYLKRTVEDGAKYEDWKFAPHATYFSPYFGNNLIDLDNNPMTVQQSASMEAGTYCVTLPDWTILDFECWPSDIGFVMKSHFGGHDKEGKMHDFYAYGFVKTNEKGEITHWETHVSPEYNDFLDTVIGVHGPFKNGAHEYMAAVERKMKEAGIHISLQDSSRTDEDVTICNDYGNTEELLKKFPVIHQTPVTTEMEKNIENRLLTGFENWNRGTEAWMKWGNILYTPDSLYNVHGVHLTLKEYQMTSSLSFRYAQMQMGNFRNMIICGDWCAIFYDIESTDRRTGEKKPGSVMEFVHFKDYGKETGTRVVEGWAGTKGSDYDGLMRFLNEDEKKAQNAYMARIASMELPDTNDLKQKYPVLHVTPDRSDDAGEMRDAILKMFDAYNRGMDEWAAAADQFYTTDAIYHTDTKDYSLTELKETYKAQDTAQKTTRLYFDSMLLSGDWAAIHFRKNIMDRHTGERTTDNEMKFLHFVKTEQGLRVTESWNK